MISTSFTKDEWEVCLFPYRIPGHRFTNWKFIVDIYPTRSYVYWGRIGNCLWVGVICFRGDWFMERKDD